MYRGPIKPNIPPSEDDIREIFLKPDKDYERGWTDAIEAAAEWLESQKGYGSRNRLEYAHGIRKLKKP